jgi:PIN domain nuclease of toxin-antitoxin system
LRSTCREAAPRHACFLWFITNDPQLSATAQNLIADPHNDILISPASYWETGIKVSLGKYPLSVPFETFITQGIHGNGFKVLPIEPRHVAAITAMPFHHRDPFDRLLVAQAQVERIPLVSKDLVLDRYGVNRLW